MRLLNKLFKKKDLIDIEKSSIDINDNCFSLVPVKVRKVTYDFWSDLEDLGEYTLPAFSLFNVEMIYGNHLKGFSIISLYETKEQFIVDTNFLENYCISLNTSIRFQDGYTCMVGWSYHYLATIHFTMLPKIKAMMISIFLSFEKEAVDAFKFGVVDVFLNMVHQLEMSERVEEVEQILFEVHDYMTKVFNTLVEMGALKEINVKDSALAFKLKTDYEENEEREKELKQKQRDEARISFLAQISARKELLENFNTPLGSE